jgi:hypothetical protein
MSYEFLKPNWRINFLIRPKINNNQYNVWNISELFHEVPFTVVDEKMIDKGQD